MSCLSDFFQEGNVEFEPGTMYQAGSGADVVLVEKKGAGKQQYNSSSIPHCWGLNVWMLMFADVGC